MEKQMYWLVESNGDLSVIIKDIADAAILIENDYKENQEGYDVEDFQYTVTPVMLTESEYEALGEQD